MILPQVAPPSILGHPGPISRRKKKGLGGEIPLHSEAQSPQSNIKEDERMEEGIKEIITFFGMLLKF